MIHNTGNIPSNLSSYAVGFDEIINRLFVPQQDRINKSSGFPPYNIRKKGEYNFAIDLAVAGLSESDINITTEDGVLSIKSNWEDGKSPGESDEYIHRGISFKKFTREFALANDILVKGANMKNGLLTIELERLIPDNKKPKTIKINDNGRKDSRSFLRD